MFKIKICNNCLGCCCKRRWKVNWQKIRDYNVMTIVLMIFLIYPMLTKLLLSMLKCQPIGDGRYLFADVEEPCFEGRHLKYLFMLTIPQLILYVLGLPICAVVVINKNKEKLQTDKQIRLRYGLLYRGYAKDREWWEVIVCIRKIGIVCVGTFGSLMGTFKNPNSWKCSQLCTIKVVIIIVKNWKM